MIFDSKLKFNKDRYLKLSLWAFRTLSYNVITFRQMYCVLI